MYLVRLKNKRFLIYLFASVILLLIGGYVRFFMHLSLPAQKILLIPVGERSKLSHEEITKIEVENFLKLHLSDSSLRYVNYKTLNEYASKYQISIIDLAAAVVVDYQFRTVSEVNARRTAINHLRYSAASLVCYEYKTGFDHSDVFLNKYSYEWETRFESYRLTLTRRIDNGY